MDDERDGYCYQCGDYRTVGKITFPDIDPNRYCYPCELHIAQPRAWRIYNEVREEEDALWEKYKERCRTAPDYVEVEYAGFDAQKIATQRLQKILRDEDKERRERKQRNNQLELERQRVEKERAQAESLEMTERERQERLKLQQQRQKQLDEDRKQRLELQAKRDAERQERENARKQQQSEHEREKQVREWEKAYEDAEKDHAAFLEQEEYAALLLPQGIPIHLRLEHTHILGPSGSGKTSLVKNIFFNDIYDYELEQFYDDIPAYIMIDPKGTLVESLARLRIFAPHGELHDRLVIIDPFDRPALNIFQATGNNPDQISSLFSYIFSTSKQQLTGKQDPCFSFCIDLLLRVPDADLFTLMNLLDDGIGRTPTYDSRFLAARHLLTNRAARAFFDKDFYSSTYSETRQQIKTRIWQVIRNEHLAEMFNAPVRTLDIGQCIAERKIILVNTRMVQLKSAHQTLGRYIIALAADAIQSRPLNSHPVYLVIDEFQEFADAEKVPELLRLIREYNGGAILAHHNMYNDVFDDAIRSAISTNTSIKFATSPGGLDVSYMARDLQCSAEFLTKQCVKDKDRARFGCYFTGLTHPFIQEVFFDEYNYWARMSDSEYRALRQRNKYALQAPIRPHDDRQHSQKPVEGSLHGATTVAPSANTVPEYSWSAPQTRKRRSDPHVGAATESQTRTIPDSAHPEQRNKRDPGEPSDTW